VDDSFRYTLRLRWAGMPKKLTVSGTEETKDAIVDLIGTVGRGLLSFCPNRRVGSHIGHTAGSFGGEGTLHWIVLFETPSFISYNTCVERFE
jgi:hypothetical protein